jgi:uncharacterized membrane protein YqjE
MNQSKIIEGLKSQASPWLKFLIGIAFVLATLFFVSLVYEIAIQQYKIRQHYVTTEAKVLRSEIKISKKIPIKISSYTRRYTPQVEYSYIVAGQQYISHDITIINPNTSTQEWAKEIVDKYRPGAKVIAYYNPRNPQKSFLIYEVAFWPYNYALYGFALISICGAIYYSMGKIYNKPRVPKQISESYYILKPDNAKKTFQKVMIVCFFYYLLVMALGVLYFLIADKPYRLFPQIVYGIYFLLGLIPICYFGYNARQSRNLQPPEVLMGQPHLQVGEKIKIKVTQKFQKAVELINAEIALVCTTYYESTDRGGKDYVRSQDDIIHKAILCKERYFLAGDVLEFEDDILVPHNAHKTGCSEKKSDFPFYRWYFRIINTQAHGSIYTTKYFVNCE